jgi:hypothetical protein
MSITFCNRLYLSLIVFNCPHCSCLHVYLRTKVASKRKTPAVESASSAKKMTVVSASSSAKKSKPVPPPKKVAQVLSHVLNCL